MKSGFIELVAKVARNQRKVSTSALYRKRHKPLDQFRHFAESILPRMEQQIEEGILKTRLLNTNNPQIRDELIHAYLRRLMRIRMYEGEEVSDYSRPAGPMINESPQFSDPTLAKDLNAHTLNDVGYYCSFLAEDMDQYFKNECFGSYKENEFGATRKFGVQLRKEGIQIVEVLKRIMNDGGVKWEQIMSKDEEAIKEYVNDEDNYPRLFWALNNILWEKIKDMRGNPDFKRVWGSSVISDTLINSILNSLHTLEDPLATLNELVDFVNQANPPPSPTDFNKRFKEITLSSGQVLPLENKVALNSSYFWATPSFKNVFLGGDAGTGRSMILTYVSMWASKNNWVVINVTNAYRMTNDTKAYYRKCYNGLYLTFDIAKKWLQQFQEANLAFLKKTPVNLDIYGKCDISGRHEDEAEPVPDLYDERRKVHHFNTVDKMVPEEDLEEIAEDKKTRVAYDLPKPKTLNDIAEMGLKKENLSISAIAEILEQIYALDVPTLVCVDGFNWFYRPSYYISYRYFNDRGLFGRVPPYHIALCRLFMDLDGHRLKKGLKVAAASYYPLTRHKFDITKLLLPKEYEQRVDRLSRDEFQNAAIYNIKSGWWQACDIMQRNIGHMYMLSQGSWVDFHKVMQRGNIY